jgi:hypothetical protein
MSDKCDRCNREVDKVVPVGDAEYSAQVTELVGVPYPQYRYLCPSCTAQLLGITKNDLLGNESGADEMAGLISHIEAQKDLMIAVATGGPRIQHKNAEYREKREVIQAVLAKIGLEDPNPHSDLWAWYGRWSSGDLPTYQSRREYIANLYGPLLAILEKRKLAGPAEPAAVPTGWARVDRGIDAIRGRLETAENEEEFQTVGLLCRETLVSLSQAIYEPSKHTPTNGSRTTSPGFV